MSKTVEKENRLTTNEIQSSSNLFKSYMEIWNKYFEDLMAACSFEDEFFEYLSSNTAQYFASLMAIYRNMYQMYAIVYPACVLSRAAKPE